jgi:diguanylate cyclase (GGDEF)-like protein
MNTPLVAPPEIEKRRFQQHIEEHLHAVFQPILDYHARTFFGFEGLIRGNPGTPWQSPAELFAEADRLEMRLALEHACRCIQFAAFAHLRLPGRLFVNASPACLLDDRFRNGETGGLLRQLGLPPSRIVIELTENNKITDFPEIQSNLAHFRSLGYQIAIDDLGEGFANLRMWSEIRPEFVKIDRHFIQDIATNPFKFEFVKAIQELAKTCNARLVAEGIENEADLRTLRDLGLAFGQGFFIARPAPTPAPVPSKELFASLTEKRLTVFPAAEKPATAAALGEFIKPVSPDDHNDHILARFEADPTLNVIPVINNQLPVGLISRHSLIDRFARPYRHELYGRKPCSVFMDRTPFIVDQHATVQELGMMLARAAHHHLSDGFIVTAEGRYIGVGDCHKLMALITEMQISAARYANPLTQLPGNVPINEHIDRLLAAQISFTACYADLDHFKPFNDAYGYRRGDDMIQLLGRILVEVTESRLDFVGHIGGDDFLVLCQSADWEARCERALQLFDERARAMFLPDDVVRGGYYSENRRSEVVFNALPTLSIGALPAAAGVYETHHEIAAAAADAKKQAKKQPGSCLFVERRRNFPPSVELPEHQC